MGVPAAVVAAVVAVANRQGVDFSLDPFSQISPALAVRMPLFVLLFLTFGVGVLLGGMATWLSRRPQAGAAVRQSKPDSNLLPPRK
jgi:hypothetical protein